MLHDYRLALLLLLVACRSRADEASIRAQWHAIPDDCTLGRYDIEGLQAAGLVDRYPDLDPDDVLVCDLGDGAAAYITQFDGCEKQWSIVVLGPNGAIRAQKHNTKDDGRGLEYTTIERFEFLVEATYRGGDSTKLYRVNARGITLFADKASFATRAPAWCRPCSNAMFEESTGDQAVAPPSDSAPIPSTSADMRSVGGPPLTPG